MFDLNRCAVARYRAYTATGSRPTRVVLIGALLTLLWVAAAVAQSDDNAALRNEVGELRRTIDTLNAKVHTLERKLGDGAPSTSETVASPANAAAGATPDDVGARWHQVHRGVSKADVEALLGQPSRRLAFDARTVWYYQYVNVGNGSVVFADDGSVIDWQTPPFGTWW